MNTECPCGINTDEIHYMDMSELEFNEKQQVVFTTDHDVDFGFGGFHEIEMWTYSEEKHIHQLAEQMKNSTEKEKISIQAQIVKFIADTMAAYEQEVLAFQRSMIREAQLSVSNQESIEESILDQSILEESILNQIWPEVKISPDKGVVRVTSISHVWSIFDCLP